MKAVIKAIFFYIISIVIFGFVYFVHAKFQPDAFIIHEQYNIHPFSSDRISTDLGVTLIDYQKERDSIEKIKLQHTKVLDSLKQVGKIYDKLAKSMYDTLDTTRQMNIEKWKHEQVPDSLRTRVKLLNELINAAGKNELTKANLIVDKANLDVKIAEIEVNSAEYILKNYGSFQDPVLARKFEYLDSISRLIDFHLVFKEEEAIRNCDYKIYELLNRAQDAFESRITFLDMLLFSASNASTVTYGDIVPNDNISRIILFFQAILCIILIAYVADSIINKVK